MDIRVLSAGCVRLGIDAEECAAMGISYESFSPSSDAARLFIAAALTRLEAAGILSGRPQKLTAEVFEDGGGLAVYISGKGLSCRSLPPSRGEQTCRYLLLKTPAEVISAAAALPADSPAALYSFRGGYALVSEGYLPGSTASDVLSAAIREYGKLRSATPRELFCDD